MTKVCGGCGHNASDNKRTLDSSIKKYVNVLRSDGEATHSTLISQVFVIHIVL